MSNTASIHNLHQIPVDLKECSFPYPTSCSPEIGGTIRIDSSLKSSFIANEIEDFLPQLRKAVFQSVIDAASLNATAILTPAISTLWRPTPEEIIPWLKSKGLSELAGLHSSDYKDLDLPGDKLFHQIKNGDCTLAEFAGVPVGIKGIIGAHVIHTGKFCSTDKLLYLKELEPSVGGDFQNLRSQVFSCTEKFSPYPLNPWIIELSYSEFQDRAKYLQRKLFNEELKRTSKGEELFNRKARSGIFTETAADKIIPTSGSPYIEVTSWSAYPKLPIISLVVPMIIDLPNDCFSANGYVEGRNSFIWFNVGNEEYANRLSGSKHPKCHLPVISRDQDGHKTWYPPRNFIKTKTDLERHGVNDFYQILCSEDKPESVYPNTKVALMGLSS